MRIISKKYLQSIINTNKFTSFIDSINSDYDNLDELFDLGPKLRNFMKKFMIPFDDNEDNYTFIYSIITNKELQNLIMNKMVECIDNSEYFDIIYEIYVKKDYEKYFTQDFLRSCFKSWLKSRMLSNRIFSNENFLIIEKCLSYETDLNESFKKYMIKEISNIIYAKYKSEYGSESDEYSESDSDDDYSDDD
jgi:hypothetical protein